MTRSLYLAIVLLFSLAFATDFLSVSGEEVSPEEASRLVLNVYLDGTGKALVTGYAENPEGLPFLNSSQYSYENETRQLYALTNALTRKNGDIWTILFESSGYYEDYRVTFYLPSDFTVKNVSSSSGLDHLFSASNDSLALDFQGYDVLDPVASIEYQQPLDAGAPKFPPPSYLLPLSLVLILAAGTTAALWWRYRARPSQVRDLSAEDAKRAVRAKDREMPPELTSSLSSKSEESSEGNAASSGVVAQPISVPPETTTEVPWDTAAEKGHLSSPEKASSREDSQSFEPDAFVDAYAEEEADGDADLEVDASEEAGEEDEATEAEIQPAKIPAEKIEISSEMSAVMETLTPRERAVLQALINRGGRSTQADLRYETRTPKSSLTGIIYSLERRKLVTKKEWGRTNVIELSEWFLSKKGRI